MAAVIHSPLYGGKPTSLHFPDEETEAQEGYVTIQSHVTANCRYGTPIKISLKPNPMFFQLFHVASFRKHSLLWNCVGREPKKGRDPSKKQGICRPPLLS